MFISVGQYREEYMNYLLVKNNIIENIIVCENDFIASQFNVYPSYETARIGDTYNPPKVLNPDSDTVEYINDYMTNALEEGINSL